MGERHFEGDALAARYARFRPSMPQSVGDAILDFLKEKIPDESTWHTHIDVGAGSGQSAEIFSPHFQRVLGVDVSESQIEEARRRRRTPNVEYVVGAAEALPVDDGAATLITVVAAAHWFHLAPFYEEAWRAMRPEGTLALVRYLTIPDSIEIESTTATPTSTTPRPTTPSATLIRDSLLRYRATLPWSGAVVRMGADFEIPLPPAKRFVVVRRGILGRARLVMNPAELGGFIRTWSAYGVGQKERPGNGDLEEFLKEVVGIVGEEGKVVWGFDYRGILMRRVS